MRRVLTIISILLLATLAIPAQDLPSSVDLILFTGASYNHSVSPKVTGTLGALYPVSESVFAGVVTDITFKTDSQPIYHIRGEAAKKLLTVGGFPIYALFDIGVAVAPSDPMAAIKQIGSTIGAVVTNIGTNVGYSGASGVATAIPIWKAKRIYAMPTVRVVKGSLNDTQIIAGVNIGSRVTIRRMPLP